MRYRLYDMDLQAVLYSEARRAFGEQDTDLAYARCNRWPDVRNYREFDDHVTWEALTPAGELWLMLNVPEGIEPVSV